MPLLTEEVKSLPTPQKAELYYLLQQDEALKNYLDNSENQLLAELARRDQALTEGKITLTSRDELNARFHKRRQDVSGK